MRTLAESHLSPEEGLAVLRVRRAVLEERIKRREMEQELRADKERVYAEIVMLRSMMLTDFCTTPRSLRHRLKHFLGFSDLHMPTVRKIESDYKTMMKPLRMHVKKVSDATEKV